MRDRIVEVARSYVGTPFGHMGRKPHFSLDCAGLLICVARELELVPQTFDVAAYRKQPDGKSLIALCEKHMRRLAFNEMRSGDAIVLITDRDPQHLGILAPYKYGGFSIIHACNSRSTVPARVIETRLMFTRGMTFRAAYAFPGM